MADEDVEVRLSVKDDASRPLRGVEDQAKRTTAQLKRMGTDTTGAMGGASKSTNTLNKDLMSLHRSALGLSSFVGGAFATGVRWGTIGLVGMGVAATGFGIKAVSQFQQTQTALDTLTGSVQAGHALFSSLQQYDLSTAFDFSQITAAAQTLEQFNISGNRTLPVLKALGDVAANTTDPSGNLSRMALAIGQISSSGVLRAQDLNQLVQAGFPAYQLAAQASGLDPAALRKQMESGGMTLPADAYLKALTDYAGPLARYKGAALAQGDTLAGALSNAPGQIRKTMAETAQPFTQEFTALVKGFTESATGLIRDVGPGVFKLAADIGHLVVDELPKAEPVILAIVGGLDRLVTEAGPVLDQVLGPLGGDVGAGITDMVDNLVPVMPDLVEGTVGFVMVLPDLVALLGDMVHLSAPVVGFIDDMLKIDGVRQGFAGLLVVLLGYRALSSVVGVVTSLSSAIMGLAQAQALAGATSGAGGAAGAAGAAGRFGKLAKVGGGVAGLGVIGVASTSDNGWVQGLGGAAGGALTGAMIGSIFPGPGTLIGGVIGAGVGGIAGSQIHDARAADQARAANLQRALQAGQPGGGVVYDVGGISIDARGMDPATAKRVGYDVGAGFEAYVNERAARR